MELYLLSCLLLGSALWTVCQALGDEDGAIVQNIEEKIWSENGVPSDILQEGSEEVVVWATSEFPSDTVLSSTTTRKNSDGKWELVFNSVASNGDENAATVRLAEEDAPGSVVLTETKRHLLYLFDSKKDGISANYQWIENGEGKSEFGIVKINPENYNSEKLCGAVELFEKSGLKINRERKFAIGRGDNGELKYLNLQCN